MTGWPAAAAASRPEVRAVRKRPRRRWRMTRKAEEAMMEPVRCVNVKCARYLAPINTWPKCAPPLGGGTPPLRFPQFL